jgi:hypothetical protein
VTLERTSFFKIFEVVVKRLAQAEPAGQGDGKTEFARITLIQSGTRDDLV